jgi:DNA-binding CsgD family transcriptional regulator
VRRVTLIDAGTGVDLQVMPRLEAQVRAALRDSIQRFGVVVPIVVTPDGRIIDGHNRWDIAQELDVACPREVRDVASEDEARELARTLNLDRRHLDRDTRLTMALSLRREGHSLRAIAEALGVSHITVRTDVGEDDEDEAKDVPTVKDLTVGTPKPDGAVIGRDGKKRSSTRRGPWSQEEVLELLDRVEAGESRQHVADSTGISAKNLANLLTRARKIRKGEAPAKPERLAEEIRVEQIREAAAEALSSHQIAERLGIGTQQVRNIAARNGIEVPADAVLLKTRRPDSARIAEETVTTLEGVASSLRLVEPEDLDPAQCVEWATSLSESLRVLTRFRNLMKEMTRESQ